MKLLGLERYKNCLECLPKISLGVSTEKIMGLQTVNVKFKTI